VIFDPKGIDFATYEGQGNITIYNDFDDMSMMVGQLVDEMNDRYASIRDGNDEFPYIVLVIDEFSDLLMQDTDKQLYKGIRVLAQKARAAKIHIIATTQRPSANILDGSLKANFPTRIACRVANAIDSRVILDESGAEKLPTHGLAILKQGGTAVKFQVAFTNANEVVRYLEMRGMTK
jgi:S-DNA-T family DNA segregation ATPase FtsK/SpoIIIE